MDNLTLITGAVRSGKSVFAEKLAEGLKQPVVYVATMPKLPGDDEQRDRIERHQKRRPAHWKTVEEPYEPARAIRAIAPSSTVIVDCLSVYVSNILVRASGESGVPYTHDSEVLSSMEELLSAMAHHEQNQFIVVTNEVGWGVVPETPLGRSFRDFLGLTNQRFAQEAKDVWLTCVGLPMRLKPSALAP